MSDAEKDPQTIALVEAQRLLGRQRFLTLLWIVLGAASMFGGLTAFGQSVQNKVDGGIEPVTKEQVRLAADVERLKSEVASEKAAAARREEKTEQRMVAVERSTLETSLNVQLLVRAAKLVPIELEPRPRDGGP